MILCVKVVIVASADPVLEDGEVGGIRGSSGFPEEIDIFQA